MVCADFGATPTHFATSLICLQKSCICFCSKNDLDDAKDKGHYKYPGTCRDLDADEIKTRINQELALHIEFVFLMVTQNIKI